MSKSFTIELSQDKECTNCGKKCATIHGVCEVEQGGQEIWCGRCADIKHLQPGQNGPYLDESK